MNPTIRTNTLVAARLIATISATVWGTTVASPNDASAAWGPPLASPNAAAPPIAGSPDCDRTAIAEAMRDLFPPAPAPVRAQNAAVLARCEAVGAEGVLAAAIAQMDLARPAAPAGRADRAGQTPQVIEVDALLAMTRALGAFRSPVATATLRAIVNSRHPPAVRAVAMPMLATAGVTDDLVAVLVDVREDDALRLAALESLTAAGRPPDRPYLTWLDQHAGPRLRARAQALLHAPDMTARAEPGTGDAVGAGTEPKQEQLSASAPPSGRGSFAQRRPEGGTAAGAALARSPGAPTRRAGPTDGTPLAIGASTVAGGALMLNLSLLGFQNTTPQLLLGTAGAVIGFGTSWALSRFGVRPTVEQAAWFSNVTGWGTLAGITIFEGSGAESHKLRYFSLIAGEVAGMAAGVWSARRWKWTGSQIVVADSLFLGTALAALGADRFRHATPQLSPAIAIGVVPVMIAAAIAGHALQPTGNDVALMVTSAVGAGWIGGLLASGRARSDLFDSRDGQGGLLLGLGLGYLGGAAAGAFTEVTPLRLKVGAAGILAGNAVGLGLHMVASGREHRDVGMLPEGEAAAWKMGAAVGGLAMGAAAFALAPRLRLGPSALPLSTWGVAYGAGIYWLALAAGHDGRLQDETTDATLAGGMLATGVAGGIAGLLLSNRFSPDAAAQWTTFGATAASISAGWGLAALLDPDGGAGDALGVTAGAAMGLTAGALYGHLHRQPLRRPSVRAAASGAAYGALLGGLLPALNAPTWRGTRADAGATMLGLGLGALGGAAASELTGATASEVTVPIVAAGLGLGAGLGFGSLWRNDTSQPERLGSAVGLATFGAASLLLLRPLSLAQPLNAARTVPLVLATGAHGVFNGIWLGAIADPSGRPSTAAAARLQGGALLGGTVGIAAGLIMAPRARLDEGDLFFISGATLAGASMGRGAGLLLNPAGGGPGAGDAAATLAGSLVGTAGGALAARLNATPVDAGAAAVGAGAGAWLGALLPSLGDPTWPGWSRRTTGGLLLGAGTGAAAGVATRMALGGEAAEVGLTALAGGDGALTGLGWALLLSDEQLSPDDYPSSGGTGSRKLRLGATIGTAAGLGLGLASWSRLRLGPGDGRMIGAAVGLAGWNGAWIGALGHASSGDFDQRRMGGGLLAAAGTASFAGALLAPVVELDDDMVGDALLMDGVFTAAGAGVGALASARDDAPVAGMLAGGAAGLLLGGALHNRLELGTKHAPMVVFGGLQGLWIGAWTPYLLRPRTELNDNHKIGGVAAGTFGGIGLAMLGSTRFAPSPEDLAETTVVASIGSAITGGVALMSSELRDQRAVGLTLAGTGVGLGLGGFLAPKLHLDSRAAGAAAVGATLGSSEALLFAWASRASGAERYAGAGLLGAGVGTALGLATNATIDTTATGAPAMAGFTAWGAWMGAFSGALFARDAHEITAGGLLGSNVGLLAGYGLLRTGAVESDDFGWLSLFGALGTVAGAAAGAPFASQAQPAPIVAGLAIGPAVGMVIGALVLPRLRAARDARAREDAPPTVSWRSPRRLTISAFSFGMGAPGKAAADPAAAEGRTEARGPSKPPAASVEIIRELQERHPGRRRMARALNASIRITDCAPLIGALPTPDSTASGTAPPMLIGITGRWH